MEMGSGPNCWQMGSDPFSFVARSNNLGGVNAPQTPRPARPPRPSFRDWALFSISMAFVLAGLYLFPRDPRGALMPLTFFAVCALAFGYRIFRQFRRRRFAATTVRVPGGVKLRGSNSRVLLLAALVAAPGIAIFLAPTPLVIRICGGVMLGGSALLVYLVVTGRISRRFLRFDPLGLTIGEPGHEFVVAWDGIVDLAEYELHRNAVVGFNIPNADAIVVTPESMRSRVLARLARNEAWSGRHVVIMAVHFGVPAESLCTAIGTYVRNREARAELVPKPALPSALDADSSAFDR